MGALEGGRKTEEIDADAIVLGEGNGRNRFALLGVFRRPVH